MPPSAATVQYPAPTQPGEAGSSDGPIGPSGEPGSGKSNAGVLSSGYRKDCTSCVGCALATENAVASYSRDPTTAGTSIGRFWFSDEPARARSLLRGTLNVMVPPAWSTLPWFA